MSQAYYDALMLESYRRKERAAVRKREAERDLDSAVIGGVVGAVSDSALLGSVAGALVGGSLAGGILGGIAGDFFNGGLLDDTNEPST
jgi:hypothetical protein